VLGWLSLLRAFSACTDEFSVHAESLTPWRPEPTPHLTPLGRQEDWEQPTGRSDGPFMSWLRRHDEYDVQGHHPSLASECSGRADSCT
jgi:hypothetical protein